jgi:hypothetical protein
VAYAVVRDVAASWEQYQRVAAAMSEPAPAGLILHIAGPTDEGFRTIDLWESEHAWQTFRSSRLHEGTLALYAAFAPRSTLRCLRPTNIVLGADLATWRARRASQEKEEQ